MSLNMRQMSFSIDINKCTGILSIDKDELCLFKLIRCSYSLWLNIQDTKSTFLYSLGQLFDEKELQMRRLLD